jgi:radical SAM protein with 4Fe4S-binding SPASM domain
MKDVNGKTIPPWFHWRTTVGYKGWLTRFRREVLRLNSLVKVKREIIKSLKRDIADMRESISFERCSNCERLHYCGVSCPRCGA